MREPNFFIVGAPKAGTTSLYHYLDQHPDIYMSPMKEPSYFALEMRPENFEPSRRAKVTRIVEELRPYLDGAMKPKRSVGIVCDWHDYLRLFAAATNQHAVGEASVCYLWSSSAARGIAERLPQARIIMLLRSPVDRAFSQYLQGVSDGLIAGSFLEYVRASLRRREEGFSIYNPFLEMGFYADQVQRYLDWFPREQIGIWIYEEVRMRSQGFMRDVLRFLGVDSTFTPDMSQRHNQPQIARLAEPVRLLRRLGVWQMLKRATPSPLRAMAHGAVYRSRGSVAMDPGDRALMLDFYRSDIHRLEGILGPGPERMAGLIQTRCGKTALPCQVAPRRGLAVWFTGLSGAGKTTLCRALEPELRASGCRVDVLDGDEIRTHPSSSDLGYSKSDRDENVHRIGCAAQRLVEQGAIVLVAAISPYREARSRVREQIGNFLEVYVNASLATCIQRDPKLLYARALKGELEHFTGIGSPYEPPLNARCGVLHRS